MKEEAQFGKWHVAVSGDMVYDNGKYFIHNYQLLKDNWIHHMMGKNWIDFNEFIPAYFKALENANIQFTMQRVFY